MSPLETIEIKNIDHLGIVAGIIDEIGIVEVINERLGVDQRGKRINRNSRNRRNKNLRKYQRRRNRASGKNLKIKGINGEKKK